MFVMLSIQQERKTMTIYGITKQRLLQASLSGSNKACHNFNKDSPNYYELEYGLSVAGINEHLAYNNYTQSNSLKALHKNYIQWAIAKAYLNKYHELFKENEIIRQ